MNVQAVFRGVMVAVGYVVFDKPGGDAMIVDTPYGSTGSFLEVIAQNKLALKFVVNTHGHWDLIADNVPLQTATGALLCAHSWDSARLANPSLGVESLDEKVPPIKPSRPDRYLYDGDVLEVDDLRFEVMATPGHTPGSICLYERKGRALFSGDIINKGSVGDTSFPGGNPQMLAQSLLKLAELPDNVRVFPAHGMATSIKEVRWLLDLAKVE